MADLIIDLVILLAILVLAAVTLLGWGRLVERVVGLSATQQVETGTLWLGFVALLGAADLVHLAIRIDWMVSLGCLLVGVAGCLMQGGAGWPRLFRALACCGVSCWRWPRLSLHRSNGAILKRL